MEVNETEDLDYKVIGTGSSGNAVRIGNIMFDCGLSFKVMKPELYKCKYLFITHKHCDHINPSTLRLIREYFPHIKVVANASVAYVHKVDFIVNPGYQKIVDDLVIYPFYCPHDKDAECTGYVFKLGGYRIIYATDTNSLNNAPGGKYDYLFLESNFDEKKLYSLGDVKKRYGYDVVQNALRHLSKQRCHEFYYVHRRSRESKLIELHQSKRFY